MASSQICVFGLRLCALERVHLVSAFKDIPLHRRSLLEHLSGFPHVKNENMFDELSVECHLGQRQSVNACDALGASPCFAVYVFVVAHAQWYNEVETVLGSH